MGFLRFVRTPSGVMMALTMIGEITPGSTLKVFTKPKVIPAKFGAISTIFAKFPEEHAPVNEIMIITTIHESRAVYIFPKLIISIARAGPNSPAKEQHNIENIAASSVRWVYRCRLDTARV